MSRIKLFLRVAGATLMLSGAAFAQGGSDGTPPAPAAGAGAGAAKAGAGAGADKAGAGADGAGAEAATPEPGASGGDGAAPGTPEAEPSAAAPEGAGEAAPATPSEAGVDGATYLVRMRDLEQRIDELKEQIRRSHTRLSLLSDTILSGGIGGARAKIRFRNEMSGAFRLVRALFVLDGAVQYNKQDDTGKLAERKEIPIFNGSIPPGDHTLQVLVQLRGHGYGVFSYLRGYKFEVKSSHSFTVTEGKSIDLTAMAYEKGGVTTPLEQRPAVRYKQSLTNTTGSATPAKAASPKGKAGAAGTGTKGPGAASGGFSVGGSTGGK